MRLLIGCRRIRLFQLACRLPFGELTWKNFERLCHRLAGQNERIEYVARNGRSGQAQQGIDSFVGLASGKYEVWQAKRYEAISARDVKAIVKQFRGGHLGCKIGKVDPRGSGLTCGHESAGRD